jgi:hypothetical protein
LVLVTIADIAQPAPADFQQSHNVVAQWFFKVP